MPSGRVEMQCWWQKVLADNYRKMFGSLKDLEVNSPFLLSTGSQAVAQHANEP
jgi:hypothetical protein